MVAPAVRELVDQPLKELSELYENSLKAMLVCGLEFYLSASLVASFFQCPDERQDEQELQTLYTLAWVPMMLAFILVYGPKISTSIFPSPEHFERNMLRCKIFTWIYHFVFLIWDPDMVIKTGPSLGVSIIFCVTDLCRFVMDMKHLTEGEYDENGNSFIFHDGVPHQDNDEQKAEQQTQRIQQQYESRESLQTSQQHQSWPKNNYMVHVIASASKETSQRSIHKYSLQSPVESSQQEQEPLTPLFGAGMSKKRSQDLALDQTPLSIKSQYVAVLDPDADKKTAEMIAKKSFTYEL
ncbi:uncharacterized protein PHALS_05989 [Plasmopara halstedii]|uniref:Uncharacterized protein n=1 Tax=Plasmopara halstedii TaxID=4781 RepID=A0A0P1ABE1_PLAHL|nr:uncharacterized protein PHALS_05989 [Plasmopara halstedii]CEG37943.1 hypothetical protein PHALS_05989 [Plasmopara halstedii]|eukprot:XP_024574312.1 hypothetical protein PHALS_05989 [Plasmopara halstedii]